MRTHRIIFSLVALGCLSVPAFGNAQSPAGDKPTSIRGARFPALSADGKRLCFSYLGDLWTVQIDGGMATRLTIHEAYDAYPRWSPDGNWIAYASNREGNNDIFLIPARGGSPRQLTFHSAEDVPLDWSSDGRELLFSSARESRYSDLYILDIKDGRLKRLTNDKTSSRYGVFSPDGKTVAYMRGRQEWWRPKYRGSASGDIYTIPAEGGKTARWTSSDEWESWPLFGENGKALYYVAYRNGASNLWRQARPDAKPEQVSHYSGGDIRFPSISRDGSRIAYEYNFEIWTEPLRAARTVGQGGTQLVSAQAQRPADPILARIYAPSDALSNFKQRVNLTAGATGLSLSPDGKTLAFVARGEVWTVSSTGGDAVRMTKTGSAEYAPVWSSDSARLAYTTDRNGNLDVYVLDVKTKVEKQVTADTADDSSLKFSEDGRFLSFVRTGGTEPGLYVLPLSKEGEGKEKDAERVGPGAGINSYDWSPDGRWLVYSKRDATGSTDLWIVPSVGGTPVNVTRYPGSNTNPQWSRDGRNIVFTSSRGSAPGSFQSNIYALRLVPEPPSDSDTPTGAGRRGPGSNEGDGQTPEAQRRFQRPPPDTPQPARGQGGGLPPTLVPPRATSVAIEFDDIHNRARAITNTRDPISSVTLSPDARTLFYVMTVGGQTDWWVADLQSGATQRLSSGAEVGGSVEFAPDASKFYFLSATGTIRQFARNTPAPTPVAFTAAMEVDRRVEVAEAFNEAWRNLRTRFYDPAMHGVDWARVRAKYEPLLGEIVAKEDFAALLQSMVGELNASHTGATPPADAAASAAATGYLGLRFDEAYAGPGLKVADVTPKGPTDQVGKHVEVGEYVLAIDGTDVTMTEGVYQTLLDKVGRSVELLVNHKPTKEGARTLKVRPVSRAAIDDLEYDRWVEGRRKKVEALSGGQLAYVHIKGMDQPSLQKFQREVFGDAQSKKGLVVDVRFNGGGRIHDDLLGILSRKVHVYETPRDAERSTQPFQVWERPAILLINEYSSSDAEIFPNGFREYKLGKLVGVPTYGGVIGTNDITLVDGTRFRIPWTGWTTLDGRNLENWGVPPDIRVEHSPEDNATDNDRQLETAVKTLLEQMR
jgi:tricorn protease